MTNRRRTIRSRSPADSARLAERIGAGLARGDTILLQGPVGAGKTHFARSLIRSLLATPEDVPSPTYTLVQTYETRAGDLWHADLYRLASADEIAELGLEDAFVSAICLVEWPEILGADKPHGALTISFDPVPEDDQARDLGLQWTAPKWDRRVDLLSHAG